MHSLDKEIPSASTRKEVTQSGLYHAIGPDTSLTKRAASHVYTDDPLDHVYQYAHTGLQCHDESTTGAAQVGNTLQSRHCPSLVKINHALHSYSRNRWHMKFQERSCFTWLDSMYPQL